MHRPEKPHVSKGRKKTPGQLGTWKRRGGVGGGVSWGGPGQGLGAAGAASSSSSTKLGHGTCQVQVAEFTKSSRIQGRLPRTGLRRAPATWKRRCASPRFMPQGGGGGCLVQGRTLWKRQERQVDTEGHQEGPAP